MRTHLVRWLAAVPFVVSMGCGSTADPVGAGGGSKGLGGSSASGGSLASGGANTSGGVADSGGTPASGGQLASGGTATAGGAKSSGGTTASGGAKSSGGTTASGGTKSSGGGKSSGGAAGASTGSGGASAGGSGGASPGCGSTNTTSPCASKGTSCSLDVGGTARKYYVQLPKNYSAATPHRLVFQFHPWGGSAEQALTMYGLNSSLSDAIFVTPQGLDAGNNGPGWANTDGQDIAFTKAMLDDVQTKYCVDKARIFSVGFSYGGMMSFAVGCEMSSLFRAIAPMAGALYSDPGCKGTGPAVAMWGSHGTNDTVVPIANGRSARDKILQQNHCGTQTTPIDPSPCVSYQGCDAGYPVTWCEWDGPHGIPNFGSAAIAAFFKQF